MRRELRRGVLFAALAAAGPIGACGTNAVGVDACNSIEGALCNKAAAMPMCTNVDLLNPPHPEGPSGTAAACIRFYSIECLHGLYNPDANVANNTNAVNGCVSAINGLSSRDDASCAFLAAPETLDACSFLYFDGSLDAFDAGTPDVREGGVDVHQPDVIIPLDVRPDTRCNYDVFDPMMTPPDGCF